MQILTIQQSIRMKIRTIRKGFEAFKCKFEPFYRDWMRSNPNSKHSNGIRSIRMQIRTIRKGFEAFESKFKPFERDSNENSNHSKGFEAVKCKFEPFERDSKHSNAKSNNSKVIRNIRFQIRTIRK